MSRDRAFKLRFEISQDDHDRLSAAFFVPSQVEVEKTHLISVYLDTADAALHEQDLIWCFSRKDKTREGRLKVGEWRLDAESDARSFVKKNRLRNQIGGVFTLRLDRDVVLHQTALAMIEIGLERRRLRNGGHAEAIFEVEFTLREGEPEELARFAAEILPQAPQPAPAMASYVERGYQLVGMTESDFQQAPASQLGKDMSVAQAFHLIAHAEIARGLEAPMPRDELSLRQNLDTVRRVQSVLHFFASLSEAEWPAFAQWEAALEKPQDLEFVLSTYLKPAARRGGWETVSGLIARVEESKTRAYATLATAWPSASVKSLFMVASDRLAAHSSAGLAAGDEPLLAYISRELAKALEELQALSLRLEGWGLGKAKIEDLRRMSVASGRLQDIVACFAPLVVGKSASKRWNALRQALTELRSLLDTEYHLKFAQGLISDAATHFARMKQTKTQMAQIYAAGALVGFLEALKCEGPERALKEALTALSEVKPFWAKID